MSDAILNSSYNILGLDNTSSEKEILRRSKEISNLIKIDETPNFDIDIGNVKSLRTEQNVKEALQHLSEPKKRVKEYFFWFDIQDSTDEDAVSNVRDENYSHAIKVWKEGIEKDNSKGIFYKKNLAILYILLLSIEEQDENYVKESLDLWGELIKSEKFWENYIKFYKLKDHLNTSTSILDDFKKQVSRYLSDIYTELSQKSKKNYLSEFTKVFGVKGERLEKSILNPIYNNINDAVEELESMKISEDGLVDEEEMIKVKNLIKKFQDELNKIVELGLYDDSQTKLIRDRAANAIRKVVLDIYNNLRETDKSIALLNIALKICGTDSLVHKLEQEIKTLEKNKKDDEVVQPVLDLMKEEKYEEALQLIERDEKEYSGNKDLQEFYTNHKKLCVSVVASKKYQQAHEKFNNKEFDEAKVIFNEIIDLLNENIDLFNFDKKGLNDFIDGIKERLKGVNATNLNEADDMREEIRKMANEKFKDQYESSVLIFWIDSYIYSILADLVKETRSKANIANILYGVAFFAFFWQWWLGLLVFAGAWYYKNKS